MSKWRGVVRAAAVTFGGALVLIIVGGVAAGMAAAHGMIASQDAVRWLVGIMAAGMMAGAVWISAEWMRAIDEAAREAHKAAWYWGGTAGMCVSGVALVLSSSNPWRETLRRWVGAGLEPIDYMVSGAILMIAPMLVGYTLVWIWWWLARIRS
jgi:hypothetical protein